jgi:hypothetical protein
MNIRKSVFKRTFLILDAIIPMPYICVSNDVRIRDYLSKSKVVREQKSLGKAELDNTDVDRSIRSR